MFHINYLRDSPLQIEPAPYVSVESGPELYHHPVAVPKTLAFCDALP